MIPEQGFTLSSHPVFDIPDLKSQFTVLFLSPQEWTVSSDDQEIDSFGINGDKKFENNIKIFSIDQDFIQVFQNQASTIYCYQFSSISNIKLKQY
jgi:hypothetical protein